MFALLANKFVHLIRYMCILTNWQFSVPIKLNPSASSTGDGGKGNNGTIGASTNVGAIAGVIVAGVVSVAAILAGVYLFLRRRRTRNRDSFGNLTERVQAVKRVKPLGFSNEAILEPFRPMSQLPDAGDQSALSPRRVPSATASHGRELPSAFPLSSTGSALSSDVSSYFNIPPTDSAAAEKQRLMMRSYDAGASSSSAYAHVSPRTVAPLAEGSSPTRGSAVSSQNTNPDLRSELDDLRREVERIRQDREAAQEAPPLYDSVLEDGLRR